MIVGSSAIIAILTDEPERPQFVDLLSRTADPRLSVATWFEAAIVTDGRRSALDPRQFDELMAALRMRQVPVTQEQARVAREAYRDFGKGSGSPAQLNFGDCFAYALAKVTGEPLLFKGDAFVHTDVRPAV